MYIVYTFVFMSNKIVSYLILLIPEGTPHVILAYYFDNKMSNVKVCRPHRRGMRIHTPPKDRCDSIIIEFVVL